MDTSPQKTALHHYLVDEGSTLAQTIRIYDWRCTRFVQNAQELVGRFKADSAVRSPKCKFTIISALNFTDEAAPLDWIQDDLGGFAPKPKSDAAKAFRFNLPHFWTVLPHYDVGGRYVLLGQRVVFALDVASYALEEGADDLTPPKVTGATPIQAAQFLSMLADASPADRERAQSLDDEKWLPPQIVSARVFQISPDVLRLNIERQNRDGKFWIAVKHSGLGRRVRRAVHALAKNFLGAGG